jgi:hypothetical protein
MYGSSVCSKCLICADECCKCFIWLLQNLDLDVAYTCMLRYVSSVFQVFHMYVCECFNWMLHMFVIVFKYFSGVFAKCFRRLCLSVFCLLWYVATVASGCFKSRSDVTHGMRMRSGWEHR